MADLNLPDVGDLAWGERVNTAIETLNTLIGQLTGPAAQVSDAIISQVLGDGTTASSKIIFDGVQANLNTLKKLATAIDNDPQFAVTIRAEIAAHTGGGGGGVTVAPVTGDAGMIKITTP